MAYCTVEEVLSMIKEDLKSSILGSDYVEDAEERNRLLLPLCVQAIRDADGEIDGYLARRYPTPIQPVPAVIHKFCKDIALYNLVSRQGIDEQDREKTILTRYNAAIKFLMEVSKGTISVGTDSGTQTAADGFRMRTSPRLFGRDSMRGW